MCDLRQCARKGLSESSELCGTASVAYFGGLGLLPRRLTSGASTAGQGVTQLLSGGEQLLRCRPEQLLCFPILKGQPSVALTMRKMYGNHLVSLLAQKGGHHLPPVRKADCQIAGQRDGRSEKGGRRGNQGRGGGGEGGRATLGEARKRGGSSSFLPRSWERVKVSRTDCDCFGLLSQEA